MMSEGLSVQYEESPGPGLSAAGPGRAVQKWRLHFAKPPSTAMAMAITPMATDMLVEKLELDEKAVRFLFFLRLFVSVLISSGDSQRRSIDE